MTDTAKKSVLGWDFFRFKEESHFWDMFCAVTGLNRGGNDGQEAAAHQDDDDGGAGPDGERRAG